MDSQKLNNLKVVELKEMLKNSGLKTSGRKAELVERLLKSQKVSPQKPPQDLTKTSLQNLPKDILFKLALDLDLPDLFSLCLSSKKYNDAICDNQDFWKQRLIKDKKTGKIVISSIKNPKKFYEQTEKKFLNKKLIEFAYSGNLEKLKKALEFGADVLYTSKGYPSSPENALEIAAYKGHFDMVKYLLDKSDRVNTAYYNARDGGHFDIANYIKSSKYYDLYDI